MSTEDRREEYRPRESGVSPLIRVVISSGESGREDAVCLEVWGGLSSSSSPGKNRLSELLAGPIGLKLFLPVELPLADFRISGERCVGGGDNLRCGDGAFGGGIDVLGRSGREDDGNNCAGHKQLRHQKLEWDTHIGKFPISILVALPFLLPIAKLGHGNRNVFD